MACSNIFLCPSFLIKSAKQCKLVKISLNIKLNSPDKYINIKLLKLGNRNDTACNTLLSSPNTKTGSWEG